MGMSHLALIGQYIGKSNVALCDTKWVTRVIFRLLGYRAFVSVDEATKRLGQIRGALIATPTGSHATLARWAIERQIPFFIEKPLTLDAVKSQDLVKLAQSAAVYAQMGFVLRYVASFQRLKVLIAEGQLGEVQHYSASMRGNVITQPLDDGDWRGDYQRGGGCLNEYGPHIIDLCRYIFGPVTSIDKATCESHFSVGADDRFTVKWLHGSGIEGEVAADWCDPSMRKSVIEFRVECANASVRVDNSAIDIVWHTNVQLSPDERAIMEMQPRPSNVSFYLRGEEFSLEIEDFLTACLGRDFHADPTCRDSKAPDLADGFEVDALIHEIAEKGGLK